MIFFFFRAVPAGMANFAGIAIATAKEFNREKRKIGRKLVWEISILYTKLNCHNI